MRVLYITTGLPPLICGVGDYSMALAKALTKEGVQGSFLVARWPRAELPEEVEGYRTVCIKNHNSETLCEALEAVAATSVLLHFSGYGYGSRGLCTWLSEGLERWKSRSAGRRIVSMFHELYAMGPPWRASFWTALPQRSIARRLVGISDWIMCGREEMGAKIAKWKAAGVDVIPVFSNVGELEQPLVIFARPPRAVVFGQQPLRARTWRMISSASAWLKRLGIVEILDIGPTIGVRPFAGDVEVRVLGVRSREEISSVLAECRLGITAYDDERLASSGTIAAYMAHGCAVLNLAATGRARDGLAYGEQLLHPRDVTVDPERVAARAHSWYRAHDTTRTARSFAAVLRAVSDFPS